jgi:hypothetical protein
MAQVQTERERTYTPMTTQFKVGDRVKAIEYTDCFQKFHAAVCGLVVVAIKHVPEAHGVAAYDRLDCELANLGEALANRHKLPETIRIEAAARFFEHEYSQASELDADEWDADFRRLARRALESEPEMERDRR